MRIVNAPVPRNRSAYRADNEGRAAIDASFRVQMLTVGAAEITAHAGDIGTLFVGTLFVAIECSIPAATVDAAGLSAARVVENNSGNWR